MKEISYYELLGMVKDEKAPERIEVKLCYMNSAIYKAEYDGDEFSHYILENKDKEDENYKFYLTESLLESSMFNKCIKILDEEDEFEDIEEINELYSSEENDLEFRCVINQLIKNQKLLIERLKDERD